VLCPLLLKVTTTKEWFIKELIIREQYKVLSINKFKEQRVIYKTKPKGLKVKYFT
jgi:hypothetical protein